MAKFMIPNPPNLPSNDIDTAYTTAQSQAQTENLSQRPAHWARLIDKTDNLYQVDELLYRSEQLDPEDIATLQQLDIDAIINLRFFDRDDNEENFAQVHHADGVAEIQPNATITEPMVLINQPLLTWWIKPRHLAAILHRIELEQHQGRQVLVHCYHGADRTGVTIAMYRIIRQGWSIEDAKTEMLEGGYGYHSIWKNIENLLTEEKVQQVREELAKLETP